VPAHRIRDFGTAVTSVFGLAQASSRKNRLIDFTLEYNRAHKEANKSISAPFNAL